LVSLADGQNANELMFLGLFERLLNRDMLR
jgi:hypothetical protein